MVKRVVKIKSTSRKILIAIGTVCVVLGVIGITLPIFPTTPFLLVAAVCYMKSSKKFYNWLINHKVLGKYVNDYMEKKGLTLKTKITSISFFWIGTGTSTIIFVPYLWAKILIFAILIIVTMYIMLKVKTIKY
ncbi:YbaN family protein [Acetivibrio saccincola]|uniref:YbaN family protein n=1 Tax=Acetivibrio saccincola TaxID=1677857 RepID=UPI001690DA60|nr:YbaN family protein [Acetivibrio saccincola]NLW27563.1 DUF454 domain-containing protein [Acetivibrio saccincola]